MNTSLRTAEYVSPKHPDKLCDRIADAILDAYIAKDINARTAIEVMAGHGKIYVLGEITSTAKVDIEPIIQRLAGNKMELSQKLVKQSPEIARGVDIGGAGDQGIMIGYATSETPEMLPLEYVLARDLNRFLYKIWPYDGKTQITIKDGEINAIVASFQNTSHAELENAVKLWAQKQTYVSACFVKYRNSNPKLFINPAGDWKLGGFEADTGLTGRKLIVDNYGPSIPIGGGAFSGKDPSKVDRSGAYMARKIAVDYLKQFQAKEVFVRLAYAIGQNRPIEATAIVDGKPKLIIGYDLSPRGIIDKLDLHKPIYEFLATNGHLDYFS